MKFRRKEEGWEVAPPEDPAQPEPEDPAQPEHEQDVVRFLEQLNQYSRSWQSSITMTKIDQNKAQRLPYAIL